LPYKHHTPNGERVDQVIKWLTLPNKEQPNFIALYFSTVDSAGHEYGFNSTQLANAISAVDKQIGRLIAGINDIPVNIILVSDHGMAKVDNKNSLIWQDLVKPSDTTIAINGQTQLYIYEADKEKLGKRSLCANASW